MSQSNSGLELYFMGAFGAVWLGRFITLVMTVLIKCRSRPLPTAHGAGSTAAEELASQKMKDRRRRCCGVLSSRFLVHLISLLLPSASIMFRKSPWSSLHGHSSLSLWLGVLACLLSAAQFIMYAGHLGWQSLSLSFSFFSVL